MKQKFIIARAAAHSYWNYDRGPRDGKPVFVSLVDDRFINGSITDAKHYDTYDECVKMIEVLGVGIFKIEKIFINEF